MKDHFFSILILIDSFTIQIANKIVLKIQSVNIISISIDKRLIEFNYIYYISELSINLISTEFIKHQSYIHYNIYINTENYFEFLSFINNDMFYINLFYNNIYRLFNNLLTFNDIMNDSIYSEVVYIMIFKFKIISTKFNLNVEFLRLFSYLEIE